LAHGIATGSCINLRPLGQYVAQVRVIGDMALLICTKTRFTGRPREGGVDILIHLCRNLPEHSTDCRVVLQYAVGAGVSQCVAPHFAHKESA